MTDTRRYSGWATILATICVAALGGCTVTYTKTTSGGGAIANGFWDGPMSDGGYYKGDIHGSKPDGIGTYWYPNGYKYVGEFNAGNRCGQGTMNYPDGGRYVGEWRADNRQGTGTCTWPNGAKYAGEWFNDVRHGPGTYTHIDGTTFVGEYRNDYVLRGAAILADGTKVEGEWGDKQQGTITYPDGRKYEGHWDSSPLPDKKEPSSVWIEERSDGHGKMTYPDGTMKVGTWRQGEFVGKAP